MDQLIFNGLIEPPDRLKQQIIIVLGGFMTHQGQALRVPLEALLLSFNNLTVFDENCLLLPVGSRFKQYQSMAINKPFANQLKSIIVLISSIIDKMF